MVSVGIYLQGNEETTDTRPFRGGNKNKLEKNITILVFLLRGAINLAQLAFKDEAELYKLPEQFCPGSGFLFRPRGGGGGGGLEANFGTGVRASFLKPTPIIYLVFEKNDLFIYLIDQNVYVIVIPWVVRPYEEIIGKSTSFSE